MTNKWSPFGVARKPLGFWGSPALPKSCPSSQNREPEAPTAPSKSAPGVVPQNAGVSEFARTLRNDFALGAQRYAVDKLHPNVAGFHQMKTASPVSVPVRRPLRVRQLNRPELHIPSGGLAGGAVVSVAITRKGGGAGPLSNRGRGVAEQNRPVVRGGLHGRSGRADAFVVGVGIVHKLSANQVADFRKFRSSRRKL